MKAESIVFAVAGMFFGVILGWVIGVQQAPRPAPVAAPVAQAADAPPVLDEARVQALTTIVNNDPKNAGAALQLGNTYFDAERFAEAIKWYTQALQLEPNNPEASTDLGVSYYYTGQVDRALQQFEISLKLSPRHTKTLLNKGIVLAFGKQDLTAAAEAWKLVVEFAPGSEEAKLAQRALEGIATTGHPAGATPPAN